MTIEDIIRLAREAGMPEWLQEDWFAGPFDSFALRFANLVAAAEREACAKLCEEAHWSLDDRNEYAAAIRARGQHGN